jgi:serine/threonine protein kinase
MAAAMALASGTKLGPYEIIAPLGAGGMGEVYRAHDPQLGRDVAIKILPQSFSRDPDRLRRFEQEGRAAAALNHPNILAVYQFGSYEGAPYLVSELLEGSTLRDQMMRGPLPVRKAVDYGIQTARGLAAAHEKGIVHRDLKPENLFLTRDGRIKILDFGLAKLIPVRPLSGSAGPTLTEGTEPGVVLGTVGYMSPEQVRGEVAGDRTDLFSLGAILYEMLTGKRAFHKPTSAETMSAILNEEPPVSSQVVPNLPPALLRVVQRCMEKNAEQRFHSASDLAFALEALSDSGSAPTGAFAVQKTQGRIWWVGAAAAVLLLMVIVAVWLARPTTVPAIESIVQLTNDGKAKVGNLETDATRIYFNEGAAGSFRIAQVSVNGGQTGEIATNVLNPTIVGLPSDASSLLVLSGGFLPEHETMWMVPIPAGEARRLGDSAVLDARVFPDGRLLYKSDAGFFTAGKDASDPRKIEGFAKNQTFPSVSPDGQRLAFFIYDNNGSDWSIDEASADGKKIRTVLKQRPDLPAEACCLRWTEDGNYLLFRAKSEGRWDLWALAHQRGFLSKAPSPVRLTNGPLSYSAFAGSQDGKRIFAVGYLERGELLHYDLTTHQFLPFLGGISAADPTFSSDGKWVAYTSYPDHALWRSRTDGSERLQLTYPPVSIGFERISPDGSQVAYSDDNGDVYVVGMSGGTPRKVLEHVVAPDWSPDGKQVAVSGFAGGGVYFSRVVDVATGGRQIFRTLAEPSDRGSRDRTP